MPNFNWRIPGCLLQMRFLAFVLVLALAVAFVGAKSLACCGGGGHHGGHGGGHHGGHGGGGLGGGFGGGGGLGGGGGFGGGFGG
ncbi:uncharacterized protein [Penaeus vannamei]|uniref:uncharacterized protein n=1 Tax=Penaeus vannamei TaxID=6689 RepID=UPI00387F91DE